MMEWKIDEEQAIKLEAYHLEYMSYKTLLESVYTSEFEPSQERLSSLLDRYNEAFYAFHIAYNVLAKEYVPEEYREAAEFIFAKQSFVIKTCGGCNINGTN